MNNKKFSPCLPTKMTKYYASKHDTWLCLTVYSLLIIRNFLKNMSFTIDWKLKSKFKKKKNILNNKILAISKRILEIGPERVNVTLIIKAIVFDSS